jgi:hypothetical protein
LDTIFQMETKIISNVLDTDLNEKSNNETKNSESHQETSLNHDIYDREITFKDLVRRIFRNLNK